MYYWDGTSWVSTLSNDGRFRWNGTSWAPVAGYAPSAGFGAASPRGEREPTPWTRPLQYAVAAWYALSGLYALTIPFWVGSVVSDAINASLKQQEQTNPTVSPPPQEVIDSITSFVDVAIWVGAVFGLVICALFVVAALKRWTWAFYVILVLLGLGAVSGPLDLVNVIGGSRLTAASGYSMPTTYYIIGLVAWVPSTALFVWMLISVIRYGPWAMRRASAS